MSDIIDLGKVREEKALKSQISATTDAILDIQKQRQRLVEQMKDVAQDVANQEVMIFVAEESYETMLEAAANLTDHDVEHKLDVYLDELKAAIEKYKANQMAKKRIFGRIKREYKSLPKNIPAIGTKPEDSQ